MIENNKVKQMWLFNNTTGCKFKCNVKSLSRLLYWRWKNIAFNDECSDCDNVESRYTQRIINAIRENIPILVKKISSNIPEDIEIIGPRKSSGDFWYDYKIIIDRIENIKFNNAEIRFLCLETKNLNGNIHCIVEIELPYSCTVKFKNNGGRAGFSTFYIDAGLSGSADITFSVNIKLNIFISLPKPLKKECGLVTQTCSFEFIVDEYDIGGIAVLDNSLDIICNYPKSASGPAICKGPIIPLLDKCTRNWVQCNIPCEALHTCEIPCCGPIPFCSCEGCRELWMSCEDKCNKDKDACIKNAKDIETHCTLGCKPAMKNISTAVEKSIIQEIKKDVIDVKLIPYLQKNILDMMGVFLTKIRIPYSGGTVEDCESANNRLFSVGSVKTNIGKNKKHTWILTN